MEYLRRPAWAGAASLLMVAALTRRHLRSEIGKDSKDKDQKDAPIRARRSRCARSR